MLLSRTSQYAISGVLRLAALPEEGYCRVEDLVRGTSAPRHAVAKVFHVLARRNILCSVRGVGGGFRLNPRTLDMTLMDIVQAVEGEFRSSVVMDRGLCIPGQPCPMEKLLQPVSDELERVLRSTRVSDIVAQARAKNLQCCQDGLDSAAHRSACRTKTNGAIP